MLSLMVHAEGGLTGEVVAGFLAQTPIDGRVTTERRPREETVKSSLKNRNSCDYNRKNAIKFGGFKKKQ